MERKLFKYKTVEFWPENGRVMVLDTEKIDKTEKKEDVFLAIKSVRPKEFMKRALAILALHESDTPHEQWEARRLVEHAEIVVRTALENGDISDPEVFDWHVRNSARRSSILLPDKPVLAAPRTSSRVTLKREPPAKILVDGYTIEEKTNESSG